MASSLVAAPPEKPNERQVAQWIKELGDDDFAVREKASRKLWLAGQTAEAALERALQSDDVEVVRRARAILGKFRWGIYGDTPADIVARIQAYQSSEGNQRVEIVQKLLQGGSAGLKAVQKIVKAEKDPNHRKALGKLVSNKLPMAFARVVETNDYEPFETLLEIGHANEIIHNNQYAAYWLLRGQLDERIAHFHSLLAKTPNEKRVAETLAYLYRAKGNLTEARKAAETSERTELIEGILHEAADWKALAARLKPTGKNDTVEKWAYRAAFARLAGKQKECAAILDKLPPLADKDAQRFVVRAFLLNDRQADGLALLRKTPPHGNLFDIFCERLEYDKARELVKESQGKPSGSLTIEWARTLCLLGEKEQAKALFAAKGEQIKDGVNDYGVAQLLREEYHAGLNDLAFEHCRKLFSVAARRTVGSGHGDPWESLFLSYVFPKQSDAATMWWIILRGKFKDESAAKTLERLRLVMEGKIAAKEVKAWIGEAEAILSQPGLRIPLRRLLDYRQVLADEAAKVGLDDLAYALLDKIGSAKALLRLGDLHAEKKQWTEAAKRYRQAWRKSLTPNEALIEEAKGALPTEAPKRALASDTPSDPLPLYLAGDALVKAGRDKEGKKLIEQSHRLPWADPSSRYSFLHDLTKRGHREAARRETELLLHVSEPNTIYSNHAIHRLAIAAAARKDYAKAAEGFEQYTLSCLDRSTFLLDFGGYATLPARSHQLRALALLDAGKFDEACKQIELAQATAPASMDLPIALVPALEKHGHKKEATTLFATSFALYEKVCRDYPRCARAHNSAAWMAACCRRNLDKALEHAGKAVELAPTNAGYIDTLAEVHFQRGEKDKAIAIQKRAIELDPKKTYYRKQLRRLEEGDPSAERPAENDE